MQFVHQAGTVNHADTDALVVIGTRRLSAIQLPVSVGAPSEGPDRDVRRPATEALTDRTVRTGAAARTERSAIQYPGIVSALPAYTEFGAILV